MSEQPREYLEDDEVFCDVCFAGIESSEHFRRCVVPAREAEEGPQ